MTDKLPPRTDAERTRPSQMDRAARTGGASPPVDARRHSDLRSFAAPSQASPAQLSALDSALIQFRRAVRRSSDESPHAVAAAGTRGGGGPLPFRDEIQSSFGRHDISRVTAHTGAEATQATRQLGAIAYATGDSVVLGPAADKHTVAHEAAHVIQQRGGVSLKRGVGEAGDRYEQHADRVADAVVAGRSAEPLLDRFAGPGTSSAPAVQRREGECAAEAEREREQGSIEALSEELVPHFNQVFAPILHVFDGGLTAESARELFTLDQMRKLLAFSPGGSVPYQLFNGVHVKPALSNSQRILMSSQILLTGTYSPGDIVERAEGESAEAEASEEPAEGEAEAQEAGGESEGEGEADPQRQLAANSCRHWGMMVYSYAGLGVPASGTDGVWHTVDPTGAIVMSAPGAPERHGVGSAGATNNRPGTTQRPAPVRDPTAFTPGDWIEIAWGSVSGGGHTVVFERLVSNDSDRFSIIYSSQNINDQGARLSSRRREPRPVVLGKSMGIPTTNSRSGQPRVLPVVFGHTEMSSAGRAATNVEELLPGMEGETAQPNQAEIQRRLRDHAPLDLEHAVAWVCNALKRDNTAKIGRLGGRLGEQQRALVTRANNVPAVAASLEQLVRLNQRLQHLVENITAVEANAGAQVDQPDDQPYRVVGNRWVAPGAGISQDEMRGTDHPEQRRSGLLADLEDGVVPWASYTG